MKNAVQRGETIEYTNAGSDILSGDVVVIGELAGVAEVNILSGTTGTVDISGRVFQIGKTTPLAINQGDPVYFNTTTKLVTATPTDVPIGTAHAAALSADTVINVKFYENGNTVVQSVVVAPLVDNSGGTANSTLQVITAGTPADLAAQGVINAAIANNFADLAAKVNAILTSLKNSGAMGS